MPTSTLKQFAFRSRRQSTLHRTPPCRSSPSHRKPYGVTEAVRTIERPTTSASNPTLTGAFGLRPAAPRDPLGKLLRGHATCHSKGASKPLLAGLLNPADQDLSGPPSAMPPHGLTAASRDPA